MNILILAAGLGTRLRPLTDFLPKPLVPVCERTLLDHQLVAIESLDFNKLFLNAHHLAEQIEAAAASRPIDHVFVEPDILGTGGPLHRLYAEGHHDDLLVLNGDILHDIDLAGFVHAAKTANAPFSLALVDNPAVNSVHVSADNFITGVNKVYQEGPIASCATFSGISWYSKEALSRITADSFSVVAFWQAEAALGRLPTAWLHTGRWLDIGTPAGLHRATFNRLAQIEFEHWGPQSEPNSVVLLEETEARTAISPDAHLDHCIVMPGATVAAGSWRNAIFIPGSEKPWQC